MLVPSRFSYIRGIHERYSTDDNIRRRRGRNMSPVAVVILLLKAFSVDEGGAVRVEYIYRDNNKSQLCCI